MLYIAGVVSVSSKLKYNFQSVGELEEVLNDIEERKSGQKKKGSSISIKTPLRFADNQGDLFEMHSDQISSIRDNLRNLINTNYGERLGHYDFGANLITVVHELGSEDGDRVAMALIAKAVSKYMPFVSLGGYEAQSQPTEGNPLIKLRLTFTIPDLDPEGANPQQIETILNFDG